MNAWRAILAAVVIFAAGAVAGGLGVYLQQRDSSPPVTSSVSVIPAPLRQRGDVLDRMQRRLYLSAEQKARIEVILRENHERMKQLWDTIAPQAQQEHRRVHELIKAELTPEQQRQYDEMFKSKRRRDDTRGAKTPRKGETGASNAPGTTVK